MSMTVNYVSWNDVEIEFFDQKVVKCVYELSCMTRILNIIAKDALKENKPPSPN